MKSSLISYSLILFSFFGFLLNANANSCDSIGTVTQNDKQYIKYKVEAGNTLYSISREHSTTVDQLKSINKIETLVVDQIILIPYSTSNYHIVSRGETLYSISVATKTSISDIKTLNNLNDNNLTIGQKLILNNTLAKPIRNVSNKTIIHEVKSGETLYNIAIKHKTTVDNIKSINKLKTNNLILGQKLKIIAPSSFTRKKTNSTKILTVKKVHLVNSKSESLNQDYCEVISPYGNVGDIIKITNKENLKTTYARVVHISNDNQLYASNNIFRFLEINSFSKEVEILLCKK